MKHFDTLKAYDELIDSGMDAKTAKIQVAQMGNFYIDLFKDIGSEFASQKLITVLGAIIISIVSFLAVEVWNLSIDMKDVTRRLTSIEEYIRK